MQKGQILLIVVLVMVVIMTVGLSIAARSISNLRTATEDENSQQAFSAAEAGIEQSLGRNISVSGKINNTATYQTTIGTLTGVDFLLNNNLTVLKDNAVDVWLSSYPGYTSSWSGNLTIFWGSPSDVCANSETNNSMAALDISLITGPKANPIVTHYPVDPCAQRTSSNNFELIPQSGGTVNGKKFGFRKTIIVTSGLVARIMPLYAPTLIAVRGCDGSNNNCSTLPSQGTIIQSTGISDKAQRKIITLKSYPAIPGELFPFLLFSPK